MCFHHWQQKCGRKSEFKIRLFYLSEKDECIFTEKVTRSKSDTLDQKRYSSFSPLFVLLYIIFIASGSNLILARQFQDVICLCASLGFHAQNTPAWDWSSADLHLKVKKNNYSKMKMFIIYSLLFQFKPVGDILKQGCQIGM